MGTEHLGWRFWKMWYDWDMVNGVHHPRGLKSPIQPTHWEEATLKAQLRGGDVPDDFWVREQHVTGTAFSDTAKLWPTETGVRDCAGIHALNYRHDWMEAELDNSDAQILHGSPIRGVVERFGKFVQGTIGWRAEWVTIKELLAQDEWMASVLRMKYPEVTIHWPRKDGNGYWKSDRSG